MAELLSMGRRYAGARDVRSDAKRLGALITGGSIALYGLSRPLTRRYRHSPRREVAGVFRREGKHTSEMIAHSSMIINASQQEVYRFWRDFENLPRFMNHLENVKVTGERRSRWIALGRWERASPGTRRSSANAPTRRSSAVAAGSDVEVMRGALQTRLQEIAEPLSR